MKVSGGSGGYHFDGGYERRHFSDPSHDAHIASPHRPTPTSNTATATVKSTLASSSNTKYKSVQEHTETSSTTTRRSKHLSEGCCLRCPLAPHLDDNKPNDTGQKESAAAATPPYDSHRYKTTLLQLRSQRSSGGGVVDTRHQHPNSAEATSTTHTSEPVVASRPAEVQQSEAQASCHTHATGAAESDRYRDGWATTGKSRATSLEKGYANRTAAAPSSHTAAIGAQPHPPRPVCQPGTSLLLRLRSDPYNGIGATAPVSVQDDIGRATALCSCFSDQQWTAGAEPNSDVCTYPADTCTHYSSCTCERGGDGGACSFWLDSHRCTCNDNNKVVCSARQRVAGGSSASERNDLNGVVDSDDDGCCRCCLGVDAAAVAEFSSCANRSGGGRDRLIGGCCRRQGGVDSFIGSGLESARCGGNGLSHSGKGTTHHIPLKPQNNGEGKPSTAETTCQPAQHHRCLQPPPPAHNDSPSQHERSTKHCNRQPHTNARTTHIEATAQPSTSTTRVLQSSSPTITTTNEGRKKKASHHQIPASSIHDATSKREKNFTCTSTGESVQQHKHSLEGVRAGAPDHAHGRQKSRHGSERSQPGGEGVWKGSCETADGQKSSELSSDGPEGGQPTAGPQIWEKSGENSKTSLETCPAGQIRREKSTICGDDAAAASQNNGSTAHRANVPTNYQQQRCDADPKARTVKGGIGLASSSAASGSSKPTSHNHGDTGHLAVDGVPGYSHRYNGAFYLGSGNSRNNNQKHIDGGGGGVDGVARSSGGSCGSEVDGCGAGGEPVGLAGRNKQNVKYTKRFVGHRNKRTVCKQAVFYGDGDRYVLGGSECGHFFVWDIHSPDPICAYYADTRVVNSISVHKHLVATSGIERTVKLWRPNFCQERLTEKLAEDKLTAQLATNTKFNKDSENTVNVPVQFLLMLRGLRANRQRTQPDT